jgi:hypothetical protein
VDGVDLSAALLGKPISRSKPLFWEYGRNDSSFAYPKIARDRSPRLAMIEGDWKLLANRDVASAELYRLSVDPSETNNLAAANEVLLRRMLERLLVWRKQLDGARQ